MTNLDNHSNKILCQINARQKNYFCLLGSCKNPGLFAVFDSSSINSFNITKYSIHSNFGCLPGKLWTTFCKIKWISSLYSGQILAKNLVSDICDYSLSIFLKCFGSNFPLHLFQHCQKSDGKITENDWRQSIWRQEKVCTCLDCTYCLFSISIFLQQ